MTTTQITSLDLSLAPLTGEFTADYDLDSAQREYATALAAASGVPTVVVAVNEHGEALVFADVAHADAARAIDWREVENTVNAGAILERHDRTAR